MTLIPRIVDTLIPTIVTIFPLSITRLLSQTLHTWHWELSLAGPPIFSTVFWLVFPQYEGKLLQINCSPADIYDIHHNFNQLNIHNTS